MHSLESQETEMPLQQNPVTHVNLPDQGQTLVTLALGTLPLLGLRRRIQARRS